MNIARLLNPKCDISYLENTDTVRQGLEKFKVHKYTAVPVLREDGTYYGIVMDRDFLTYITDNSVFSIKELENIKISNIIKKGSNPPVNINATIEELILRISDWNFVPVVDSRNIFIGIITRKSVISFLNKIIQNNPNAYSELL